MKSFFVFISLFWACHGQGTLVEQTLHATSDPFVQDYFNVVFQPSDEVLSKIVPTSAMASCVSFNSTDFSGYGQLGHLPCSTDSGCLHGAPVQRMKVMFDPISLIRDLDQLPVTRVIYPSSFHSTSGILFITPINSMGVEQEYMTHFIFDLSEFATAAVLSSHVPDSNKRWDFNVTNMPVNYTVRSLVSDALFTSAPSVSPSVSPTSPSVSPTASPTSPSVSPTYFPTSPTVQPTKFPTPMTSTSEPYTISPTPPPTMVPTDTSRRVRRCNCYAICVGDCTEGSDAINAAVDNINTNMREFAEHTNIRMANLVSADELTNDAGLDTIRLLNDTISVLGNAVNQDDADLTAALLSLTNQTNALMSKIETRERQTIDDLSSIKRRLYFDGIVLDAMSDLSGSFVNYSIAGSSVDVMDVQLSPTGVTLFCRLIANNNWTRANVIGELSSNIENNTFVPYTCSFSQLVYDGHTFYGRDCSNCPYEPMSIVQRFELSNTNLFLISPIRRCRPAILSTNSFNFVNYGWNVSIFTGSPPTINASRYYPLSTTYGILDDVPEFSLAPIKLNITPTVVDVPALLSHTAAIAAKFEKADVMYKKDKNVTFTDIEHLKTSSSNRCKLTFIGICFDGAVKVFGFVVFMIFVICLILAVYHYREKITSKIPNRSKHDNKSVVTLASVHSESYM